jgi:hypothetical protein
LFDTIHWATARGIPFSDPTLAITPTLPRGAAQQSLQPVHQAALPPLQPVHQAQQSLQPVHQAASLPLQPVHQVPRRLQIEYDLPAGVDAVPGSPGTVLFPLQVENSSKKRKVRLQLARSVPPARFTSPLPTAAQPPKQVLTLLIAGTMSANDRAAKRGSYSPAGSLDEFDDTPERAPRAPLAIGATQSDVARGKQPVYPPHTYLARHGYRQPSVIPESEEDDAMDGVTHHIVKSAPKPAGSVASDHGQLPHQPAGLISSPQQQYPSLQQDPPQQRLPRQQFQALPQPPLHQFPAQQSSPQQYPLQQYLPQQQPLAQQGPQLQQQPPPQQYPPQHYAP